MKRLVPLLIILIALTFAGFTSFTLASNSKPEEVMVPAASPLASLTSTPKPTILSVKQKVKANIAPSAAASPTSSPTPTPTPAVTSVPTPHPQTNQINGVGKGDSVWWTYKVNGKRPSAGCSQVKANNNDNVVWEYIGPN